MVLDVSDVRFTLVGKLVYEWHPSTGVRMYATSRLDFPADVSDATLAIPELDLRGDCLLSVAHTFGEVDGQKNQLRGLVSSPLRGGSLAAATSLVAYVAGLPEMGVLDVATDEGDRIEIRRARTVLASTPWQVVLDEVAEARSVRQELAVSGGFGFTHVCQVTRTDGAHLAEDAVLALEADLRLFFSFLRGFHCSPVLLEGVDVSGKACWRSWERRPQEYWRTVWEWRPILEPTAASELFPGFMTRRAEPMWREPLRLAIHWYVSGNTFAGGSAGAIVLVQSALEMLAWEYVNDSRMPKLGGQSRQQASDKIRGLLQWAGIPTAVPAELISLATAHHWNDVVHALTDVRNAIVHPEPRHEALRTEEVVWECWRLSLELLELVILRLCDYRGNFYSRVRANRLAAEVSRVPWLA
jgi:hypothetical protein